MDTILAPEYLVPAADRTVKLSDNSALSLAEILEEETLPLRARAELLVGNAAKAKATTQEDVEKCVTLAGMFKDHLKKIEDARKERKQPFLDGGRAVDSHFNGLAAILVTLDAKGRVTGGPLGKLMKGIDDYRREQERLAEIERRRLAEEARKAREAQEAAERARLEAERKAAEAESERDAEKARADALEAEMQAKWEQEEAERLQREAEMAAAPQPITTAYGVSAGRRTVHKAVLDQDIRLALMHAMKIDPDAIRACVQSIYDKQVRAGVRSLPGATVVEDSATVIRV